MTDENITVFCSLIIFSLLSTYLIYLLTKTNVTKTEPAQILNDMFEKINVQVSNISAMINRIEWHEERLKAMDKELNERERARRY